MFNTDFWVALGFVCFIGVLFYLRVPQQMLAALDDRGARIRAELDEARRLREDAQRLAAEYEGKRQAAEAEAAEILAGARREAEAMAGQAKTRMDEFVARRTKMAEMKIAQAETQAMADVRAVAAEASITAASRILAERLKGEAGAAVVERSIGQVRGRLN